MRLRSWLKMALHAARDHANDAKDEHQVHHMAAGDQLHADDAVEDLNEQEDIALLTMLESTALAVGVEYP
mgnify:CR=1 FL=1